MSSISKNEWKSEWKLSDLFENIIKMNEIFEKDWMNGTPTSSANLIKQRKDIFFIDGMAWAKLSIIRKV